MASLDRRLLGVLARGEAPPPPPGGAVERWAGSGAMALTGHADGPPLAGPAGATRALDRLAGRLHAATAALGAPVSVDGPALLGERAALTGYRRAGRTSVGGAARLLPAADGWVAVSLARPDDVDLVPAWLCAGPPPAGEPWPALAELIRHRPTAALVDRGAGLGLAVAALGEAGSAGTEPAVRARTLGTARPPGSRPLVVNLASLWAGPLCAQLLQSAGARVVTVEGADRPDGARLGAPAFFDHLHAGQEAVAVDLTGERGRDGLRRLLRRADVVVEGSRARALDGLGCGPAHVLAGDGGPAVWVSITGHGRSGPGANRVGLGDDAAVAGGLVARDHDGDPVFCADAAADPAAGLAAAAAAAAALAWGRPASWHLDVAMSRVAAALAAGPPMEPPAPAPVAPHRVARPRARPRPPGGVPAHGADTAPVLAEVVGGRP